MSVATNLTRDEAATRAGVLTVSSYDVDLTLPAEGGDFTSRSTVRFASSDPGGSTFIEIAASGIREATLNGAPVDVSDFDGGRLTLTGLAAENELTIEATCQFSRTGEGLHRFVDPVDGEVYLYSQFETYDAHRMYACFDQPDLKATFTLAVTAPEHWVVVTNAALAERSGGRWTFTTSKPMSTYITALVAGPYHEVLDVYEGPHGTIPLGLYCRNSVAQHLDAEELFAVTRQGFDFFHRIFDYPYPFGKYDQLFVPEFNAGAMENAGAVTLHEDYVFRSKVTDARYERRAETILHEMAHMWFGDLVTMRWWDDLWLNESFATYISVLCQAEATRWTNAWTTFCNTEKTWAYRQDQLPSTHPISADATDIVTVKANFDGITYAKGASVLKQLVAWVGQEEFLAGVRGYFRKHEWGNTSLADLLAALHESSGRDLSEWSALWLETAGVATLRAEFTLDDGGAFTSFALLQEATAEHPTLRPHRVAVGLYDLVEGSGLVRRDRVELDVTGARTEVPKLVGARSADLVLVNDDDLAFAKIRLDERSLRTVTEHIGRLTDSLPRALCWAAAWDMTRDAEMASRDYLALVLNGLEQESDIGVVQSLLAKAQLAITSYGAPDNLAAASAQLAGTALDLLRGAAPGSDLQLAFAAAFAHAAATPEQLDVVRAVFDGDEVLDGLAVDTDLRWTLLTELVAHGLKGDADIDAELARDQTAAGAKRAASARTARPTAEAKAAAWHAVMESDELSNHLMLATMGGFWRPDQLELTRPYVQRFFDDIGAIWAGRTTDMAQSLTEYVFPAAAIEEATLAATDAYLAGDDVPGAARRPIVEGRDAMTRALRARATDIAAG